jgi:hypothetical protein
MKNKIKIEAPLTTLYLTFVLYNGSNILGMQDYNNEWFKVVFKATQYGKSCDLKKISTLF